MQLDEEPRDGRLDDQGFGQFGMLARGCHDLEMPTSHQDAT